MYKENELWTILQFINNVLFIFCLSIFGLYQIIKLIRPFFNEDNDENEIYKRKYNERERTQTQGLGRSPLARWVICLCFCMYGHMTVGSRTYGGR